jgi:two-component system response regulator YesN
MELLDNIKEYSRFFISIGARVNGLENIYHSYETAVIAMQKSFFKEYNSILPFNDRNVPPYTFDFNILKTFEKALLDGSKENAVFIILSLSSELRRYDNTLVVSIKDFFFKLSQVLLKVSTQNHVDTFMGFISENFIWEAILKMNTLTELEKFLTGKIDNYFVLLKEETENRGIVKEIIKYIQKNYQDESLSINSLSEYINLSQTYICSLFKEETGKTINQYITEYRIEKSKQLLKDIRLRVSEVSCTVGYADANYFAKLFRKITGYTPSEYRKKDTP